MADAWVAILAAGAVTQLLRYVPLLLLRGPNRRMPAVAARILEYAGWSTLGGLIALAVFRAAPEAASSDGTREVSVKLMALALSGVFYGLTRRTILSLALGYAGYLSLVMAFL